MPRLSTLWASIGSSAPSMRHIICRISATETGAGFATISLASAAAVRLVVAVVDLAVGKTPDRPASRVAVEGVGAGGKIGAGAEAAARAGNDDGADIVVIVGGIEGVDQFVLHDAVEGVELVGPV